MLSSASSTSNVNVHQHHGSLWPVCAWVHRNAGGRETWQEIARNFHQRMRDLSNAVRLTSALSAVLVIVASLSPRINDGNDAGGYPIMFSWHPVFMTIGLFLLTQGLVSYISTFGSKVWKLTHVFVVCVWLCHRFVLGLPVRWTSTFPTETPGVCYMAAAKSLRWRSWFWGT